VPACVPTRLPGADATDTKTATTGEETSASSTGPGMVDTTSTSSTTAPTSACDDESTADATAGALEPCNTEHDECPPGTECVPTGTTPGSWAGSCTPTCDLAMNDCPEGEKCLAFGPSWEYQHCVPVASDPAGAGEPCSGTARRERSAGLPPCSPICARAPQFAIRCN